MTTRKLSNTNPIDLLKAALYANMIPGLNDTDWEVIYGAVNEAVEKAAQGDPAPEGVLLFEIPDYPGPPHLAVIELFDYVPTNPARKQGCWTTVRAHLVTLRCGRHE